MTDDLRVLDDDEPTPEEVAEAAALAALMDGAADAVPPEQALALVPEREVVGLLTTGAAPGVDLDRAWDRVAASTSAAELGRSPSPSRWSGLRLAIAAGLAAVVAGGVLLLSLQGSGELPPAPTVAQHRAAVTALSTPANDSAARAKRLAALQQLADVQRRRLIAELHDG